MTGISTKTVYAVAALHELNSLPEGEVMKIKEIAARAYIPPKLFRTDTFRA